MPTNETLRITIPKALDLGNMQVASRRFDTVIYTNRQNAYVILTIGDIRYTPTIAKVQLWVYQAGIEVGQYGGSDGIVPFNITIDETAPITLALFNLSSETEVNFTLSFTGILFGGN